MIHAAENNREEMLINNKNTLSRPANIVLNLVSNYTAR
ncbi:MAG: hypothetical protein FD123_3823 [Bacteroidetes bacterium]|nr:MAG: hypothetical protein FD123_3823 [Bacteroidota bacterium]